MQKSNKKQKLTPGGEAETNVRKCSTVLKALQRNPRAGAFLMPVDWKALKLPQYPKMIKTPMDLGTVEQKLNDGRYKTIRDWADDIRLVWSNACTFNTEGSDVFELATQLSSDFEGRLDGLPMSGSLREAGGGGRGGMQPDELSACKAALKEVSPCAEPSPPLCRHPLAPRAWQIRKHKDAAPFLDPVDWKALGIPDYPTIIKRPMDLGTVMRRLESNEYDSVANLSEEINLVWNNAMTYNMDDSWIHQSAVRCGLRRVRAVGAGVGRSGPWGLATAGWPP